MRSEGSWPATRLELEAMSTVGQYVASAVLMFEYGMPAPLMGASMARVMRPYFAKSHRPVDDPEAVRVNWVIWDLAALQCKRVRQECDSCTLQSDCA